MSELKPIASHLRACEVLDSDSIVIRGWPLTIDGLLRNADATRRRYSFRGHPLVAISAQVTLEGREVDATLFLPAIRTCRSYAMVAANDLLEPSNCRSAAERV